MKRVSIQGPYKAILAKVIHIFLQCHVTRQDQVFSGGFPSKGRDDGENGELDTQDVGKGRRIEAKTIVGGGLESSVEREPGHTGRIFTGAGVESCL